MNLHRASANSDWANINRSKWNTWQKVAAASLGILTPGNFLSLLGLLSVPVGLWLVIADQAYLLGAAVLALGRLCDVADGMVADKTGTKSPFGEKLDAGFDKVSTGLAVIVLALYSILPFWVLIILLVPHIVTAALVLAAYGKGRVIHPSRDGKLSMAAAWLCLLAFVVVRGLEGGLAVGFMAVTFVLVGLSIGMASRALKGYIAEFQDITKSR